MNYLKGLTCTILMTMATIFAVAFDAELIPGDGDTDVGQITNKTSTLTVGGGAPSELDDVVGIAGVVPTVGDNTGTSTSVPSVVAGEGATIADNVAGIEASRGSGMGQFRGCGRPDCPNCSTDGLSFGDLMARISSARNARMSTTASSVTTDDVPGGTEIPGENGAQRIGMPFVEALIAILNGNFGGNEDEEDEVSTETPRTTEIDTGEFAMLRIRGSDGVVRAIIPVAMMRSTTQGNTRGEARVPTAANDEESDGEQ